MLFVGILVKKGKNQTREMPVVIREIPNQDLNEKLIPKSNQYNRNNENNKQLEK